MVSYKALNTVWKCIVADTLQGARKLYFCQVAATREGVFRDACKTWKIDAAKTNTAVEGISLNAFQWRWKLNRWQIVAEFESVFANCFNFIRKDNVLKLVAVIKCITSNMLQILWQCDFLQRITLVKSFSSNLLAIVEYDFFKIGAISKGSTILIPIPVCSIAYANQILWHFNRTQLSAVVKSQIDILHAFWQLDSHQFVEIGKRMRTQNVILGTISRIIIVCIALALLMNADPWRVLI